jgi:hypothetical protein
VGNAFLPTILSYHNSEITAKDSVNVYQSQIAKFSVNDGAFIRNGSEIQTIVTQRDLFTETQSMKRYITGQ